MINLTDYSADFNNLFEHLKTDLKGLRTGRAHSSLVENIMVEAYGAQSPIKQMANISIPDARTLVIEPWDKSVLKDIEKGIVLAQLGINPVNEGKIIRISIPPMTEENRKQMVKVLGEKVEKARVSLRQLRDKIKEDIISEEKTGAVGEDVKFRLLKNLDEMISENNDKISAMAADREQEIMNI